MERRIRTSYPGLAVHLTTGPDDAETAAFAWAREGGERLLVLGGDGTLHEALNGVARAERLHAVRLSLIPAGTGNDFARSLGVAGRALPPVEGDEARVDLGRIRYRGPDGSPRERLFLNSTSLGLSVRGNALAHRARRYLPPGACYVLGAIGALLTERRARRGTVRLVVDGEVRFEGRPVNLTIANGATFGAGLRIAPGASVADGILDHVVVGDVGFWGAVRVFLALLGGRHLSLRAVQRTRGAAAIVEVNGRVPLEADGCLLDAGGPIAVDILPAALRVIGASDRLRASRPAGRTPPLPAPAAP